MFVGEVATFDVSGPGWRFWRRWQRQTLTVTCPEPGTLLIGGIAKLCASTDTREHGTPTRATGMRVDFSFSPPRGDLWVGEVTPTMLNLANSFTAPGSYGAGTVSLGESGGQRGSAA